MFECCSYNDDVTVEVTTVASVSHQQLDPSETGGLVITFELPDQSRKDVLFKEKPLGLEFKRSSPLSVSCIRDVPEVQCGWIITHLQGEAIAPELNSATLQLIQHVKDLPTRPSRSF
eukprot:symbB.v1.2.019952.t1/scaffold1606.1/size109632/8